MMDQRKLIEYDTTDVDDSVVAMIRETVDPSTFERFCKIFGGNKLMLPSLSNLSSRSSIVKRLGIEDAKKIMDAVGVEAPQIFYVPRLDESARGQTTKRIEELLAENGISIAEIVTATGSTVRTVYRCKARMRQRGLKVGDPKKPRRKCALEQCGKGETIVRQLLLEGHSPSLLRDIMNIPATVILTIRAELLKQGKLN